MKIRFLEVAQQELDNAVAWYNQQSEGVGQGFLDELDRAVRRTVKFPLSCPEIEPGIRRRLIARFPYGLIYGIDVDTLVVIRWHIYIADPVIGSIESESSYYSYSPIRTFEKGKHFHGRTDHRLSAVQD